MPFGRQLVGGNFEKAPAGSYKVTFANFFPQDDDGFPVLSEVKGDKLVMRFNFLNEVEEGEQPIKIPASLDANEDNLKALVRACGGDTNKVVWDEEDMGKTLLLVQRQLVKARKVLEVNVNEGGWVNSIEGINVPAGNYKVKFGDLTTKNEAGKPAWKVIESKFGESACSYGDLVVTAGKYKGLRVPFQLFYPFVVSDTGEISWGVKNKKGGGEGTEFNAASKRFRSFMETFGVDPDGLDPDTIQDHSNVLPEFFSKIDPNKEGQVEVKDSGWANLDKLMKIISDDEDETPKKETPPEKPKAAEKPKPVKEAEERKSPLVELMGIIEAGTFKDGDASPAFDAKGDLTPEGKAWCGKVLKPLCAQMGIQPNLKKMSAEDAAKLVSALNGAGDQPF